MTRKAVPIVLMILGVAMFLGVILFALDNATSAEPEGLGTWIFTVLGLVLGASTGIKGWVDWNRKETPSQVTRNTAFDGGQIAAGEKARNIQTQGSSQYQEQNIQNYYEAPKPDVPAFHPLHQLPQPPADFTGREEIITQLIEDFNAHKGATITGKSIHGLTGMGGIGKTTLGLVVAHQIAENYPDAQIFLDLKGTTTPLSAMDVMRHVVLSFEPTADIKALDEANMSNAYQSVLHGKQALLFLDNARSAGQIAGLRPPETCAMLVTSRWVFTVPGLQPRRLDLMNERDAISFLIELCPRIGDKAGELAKACAFLPLALRIAGSFLQVNEDWSVGTYLNQLNDRGQRLATLHQSREEAELTAEPDLLATFELSYNGLSPEDRKRWRMLGVFPAAFNAWAAQAMWELEEDGARRLLGLLRRYSLLEYDASSSRYSLHDLLADYALAQMDDQEEQEARLLHASHYKDVLGAADDLYKQGGENTLLGLRLFDLEWENIRTGQAWAAGGQGNDPEAAKLCHAYSDTGADVINLRLHPIERIQWLTSALSAAREIGDRRGEGNALGNLGIAYKDLGEARKAIEYHEGHLKIAREVGDRRGEGIALGNLGIAYAALGEARKAIEYYEGHLKIAREVGDRRGEGNALGNLGIAYAVLGEARKAIEYHEQALVILREIGDRRGEGAALGNLGIAYADLGEARKAIEYYEQQLVIVREIGDRHGEGNALGNLGIAFYRLGEARKAIEYHEQALAIDREIGDRRGEASSSWNLGLAYEKQGELKQAIEAMQIWVDFEREMGHPDAEKDAARVEELRQKLG